MKFKDRIYSQNDQLLKIIPQDHGVTYLDHLPGC